MYRVIENTFGFEKYLIELPLNNKTKCRCLNQRLPIKASCRAQTQHNNDIGDEYHDLLFCPLFIEERVRNINDKFWKRPSTIQLEKLLKQNHYNYVLKLSSYVELVKSLT